jgi:hypothetical protein
MKLSHLSAVLLLTISGTCSASGSDGRDFLGVTCSSVDGGKTCFGYGETYPDGTSDACGQIPNGGPKFAVKMTYEIKGETKCETLVQTSDPKVMPVGKKVCAIRLEQTPDGYTYRFPEDPSSEIRKSYNAPRSDKWCQSLIDALR